ncbi:MAG: efflux RND transporter permease subunit [Arenicella sp.]
MMHSAPEKDIATLYFRNRHLLVLTIVILLIGGWAALSNLPRLEDPRITTRNATILTFLPGASANRIEALINEKIESTLEEISDIKTIESTARSGVSSISIGLQDSVTTETNEDVFSKVRSRLQNIQGDLPVGASIPVLEDNRGVTAYTLIIGISWNGQSEPPLNILQRIALDLKDRMLNTGNTELVRIFGGVNEEIVVTPDKGELASLNMSAEALAGIIAQADSKVSAGQLRSIHQNIPIEVNGGLSSVEQVARIPLMSSDQGMILTVGDIASVKKTYQSPVEQVAIKDGKRTLYVAIRADDNVRVDQWTQHALKTYQAFKAEYSDQIGMDIIFQQNHYTEARLGDLVSNLVLGALFVVIIVLFTMGWKSALVVGSVLPLSAAGSIFAFNFFDQSIHQMSIFGMIIAIGLLIDSAIVMTDEVRKSIHKGMNRLQALQHSVHHLFVPLLASTLTTILGFMPIFLLPGNAGDFVSPIAISVILALVFSFFLAITVIPALAASVVSKVENTIWWQNGLGKPKVFEDFKCFSLYAIERPKRYLLLTMIPCLVGFLMMGTMKVEFFPAADRDMFEVQMFLPSDSSITYTQQQVDIADHVIKSLPGVTATHWLIGGSTPAVYYNQIPQQDNNSAYAQAVITATNNQTANRLISKVQNALSETLPNVKPIVKKFAQGPPADAPVAFRILGAEVDTLRRLGEQVRALMHQNPEIINTRASIEGGQAKLWFKADEAEAELAGLNLVDIANQFQGNLEGYIGGSILEGVEELPIRVRLNNAERADIASVANMQLSSPSKNRWVPAEAIGRLELHPEISEITRYNGQRVNTVLAYTTPDAKAVSVSSDVLKSIQQHIDIPTGYRINVAGESEQQADAVSGLATFAPVLFTLMVTVIILAFRSVAIASIVFIVAILSVGLGMLSLKIAGYPLGFNPLIGSIGLAGVIINDSIVILAAILGNEKARRGDSQSIIEETYGCGRHVLSTTLTTIGGFVPLLLFSGGSFWPPLTVVIAGGIGFGLMLALLFTPLAYKVYADRYYRKEQTSLEHHQGVIA